MSAAQSNLSIQDEISAAILQILNQAQSQLNCEIPGELTLDRPKNREHGDYATSIALALAKPSGQPPRKIAEIIVAGLSRRADIAAVEIAGAGFVNITLATASQGGVISNILAAGKQFGHGNKLNGVAINLEFISANPTGPLHLGHTRWAAVGDALGRVLAAAGAKVVREFYVNDRGVQMDKFGASLQAVALAQARPEDGYHGAYIAELATEVIAKSPKIMELSGDEQLSAFRDLGYELQLAQQKEVLDKFGTHFDVWFSEKSLYENNFFTHCQEVLKSKGHVFEEAGAIWLRTTDFGDDKDRVMVKSDGSMAYFASDSAYYISKRERGFEICIYMLGADHHGYTGRLKALAACNGDDPEYNVHVLIGQMVKIMEGGEEVKLSKRAGTIITLEELVEKVGVDAARYTLIRYPVDTPMVMDVDILRSRTNENPVYYVQYAHARICAVLRNASDVGIKFGSEQIHPDLLVHERERELIGALGEFPRVVAGAAELREPHRVARYVEELAGVYHRFYSDCRVLPLGDETPSELHSARATLCLATAQVISNGLELLGVSAPEKM
ncbi:MAG: arginine--tRNA ligase [SAR202 cluster bacterium]|jgi:arginyl-tRNA synthetase|nr:arginine--tRNA ligase [SAR202 cluster bacterium]|tara:strand:- start:6424 stop:8100 length:1677 start_codon:yes stop_codon:yes gene_type:complete